MLLLHKRAVFIRTNASANKRVPINELPSVPLPLSMDEAVAEAAACVKAARGDPVISKAKSKTKGFASSASPSPPQTSSAPIISQAPRSLLTALEVPVDPSPQAIAQLACQIAMKLGPTKLILVVSNNLILNECRGKSQIFSQCLDLQEACRQDQLKGVPLLAGLKVEDVALAEQLISEVQIPGGGSRAVIVNCDFDGAPTEFSGFLDQIEVVWSFKPLEFSLGLLGKKEGAVLKRSEASRDPSVADWRILFKLGDRFVQVGKSKSRPSLEDVENLVINASAAMGQVSNAIRGLKQGLSSILPQQNKS